MRTSRSPTTVMTANGEVQTKRRSDGVCTNNLTYSSKLCFLKKLPQFFPWGNFVRNMGIQTTGSAVREPHLIKNGKRIDCNISNYVPFVVPGLSASSSLNYTFTCFSFLFITGFRIWCQQIHRKSSTRKKWKYEWRASGRPETTWNRKQEKLENQKQYKETSHELPDWLQEFKDNLVDGKYFNRAFEKPRARKSTHLHQVVSWISNGAVSKSGTGFG